MITSKLANQKVNLAKSKLFASPNTSVSRGELLVQVLGINIVEEPERDLPRFEYVELDLD